MNAQANCNVTDHREPYSWECEVERRRDMVSPNSVNGYRMARNTISRETIQSALLTAQSHDAPAHITRPYPRRDACTREAFYVHVGATSECIYATVHPDGSLDLYRGFLDRS